MKEYYHRHIFALAVAAMTSCELPSHNSITDDGEGIQIAFLEGLNDNPSYELERNSDGFYELVLDRTTNQTIQRITGTLTREGRALEDVSSGKQAKKVSFTSNLYWWLLEGETVANITYTYINEFTGELTYVNLPPLVNWKDVLVPTVNGDSYTQEESGIFNTVIAPIQEMVGDTLHLVVTYNHPITRKSEGSSTFEILGHREFKDSTSIVLK